MSKLFVPLDLETTGLDHEHDKILEVAWVVTDENLYELSPRRTFVVDHGENWADVFSQLRANEFVRNMHEESGLLNSMSVGPLHPLWGIADQLRADIFNAQSIQDRGGEISGEFAESVHLMGFSIGFDRAFMQVADEFDMLFDEGAPKYESFHHRLFDLSSVKLMLEAANIPIPEIENTGKHRALNDVYEVLTFARVVRSHLAHMYISTGEAAI